MPRDREWFLCYVKRKGTLESVGFLLDLVLQGDSQKDYALALGYFDGDFVHFGGEAVLHEEDLVAVVFLLLGALPLFLD